MFLSQNLPNLAQSPRAPEAPTFLPPVRGGAIGLQARRVLADKTPDPTGPGGVAAMPGAIVPRRLPALTPPTVATLGSIPEGKGKGPIDGRPTVKKSPHASSEEDVSGAEGKGGGSGSSVTSPPFPPTRPLAPVGPLAINSPLPPIRGVGGGAGRLPAIRRPPPTLNLPPTGMPARRTAADPFSPLSPTRTIPGPPNAAQTRPSVVQAPPTTNSDQSAPKTDET